MVVWSSWFGSYMGSYMGPYIWLWSFGHHGLDIGYGQINGYHGVSGYGYDSQLMHHTHHSQLAMAPQGVAMGDLPGISSAAANLTLADEAPQAARSVKAQASTTSASSNRLAGKYVAFD